MSKEAASEFRDKVLQDEKLQAAVRSSTGNGSRWDWEALIALGVQNGMTFTANEGRDALSEVDQNELSDFELELAAGGGTRAAAKAEDSRKWTEKSVHTHPEIK